ncbi:hypothetical protein BP6252_00323 [Coleophoma cylindrospora]|uniref:Uncharacterized protein n=1 Tax=Coleophoma cylindrospora TaxID=1849047 RepID=A0A3D8SQ47_9HELO|nr:hypothetical protein BP6252_00323 [Coleophoma cylindrospora]
MENSLPDISQILTPSLYQKVFANQFPWPQESPLDFAFASEYMFEAELTRKTELQKTWYPALKSLSLIPLPEAEELDLTTYLPAPTSPDFAWQALALRVLLDQGPRIMFGGDTVDARWTNGFFDVLSNKLTRQFLELPQDLQPWNPKQWPSRVHFDFLMPVNVWWLAALAHSEILANHDIAVKHTEVIRNLIEERTGTVDPYRADKELLATDVHAFGRMMRKGTPKRDAEGVVKMEEFMFWMLTVIDVHRPIIERYGRYPYRNGALGRTSTEDEVKWLDVDAGLGTVDDAVATRIREDVEAGRWTPLGESREERVPL